MFFGGFFLVWLAVIIAIIAPMWKIFTKAGKPGWASIVPIYNLVVLHEIVGKPAWWVILMIVPIVNFVFAIIVLNELSRVFGRGGGFTVGLIFLPFIFFPILGFGSDVYRMPGSAGSVSAA